MEGTAESDMFGGHSDGQASRVFVFRFGSIPKLRGLVFRVLNIYLYTAFIWSILTIRRVVDGPIFVLANLYQTFQIVFWWNLSSCAYLLIFLKLGCIP